jgi:AraC-like DNA-binding protein
LKGDVRVSEAAFEAGFNSIPYFNRAFRRYVGCPPSEFRARGNGTNEVKRTTIRA